MKAYSLDLRERVVKAVVEKQTPRKKAAELFNVSVSTVGLLVRTYLAGKSLAPRFSTGRPRAVRPEKEALLESLVKDEPDLGLAGWCERLARDHGLSLSVSALSRTLRSKGWSHKKKPSAPASATRPNGRNGGRTPNRNCSPKTWFSWTKAAPTGRTTPSMAGRPRRNGPGRAPRATGAATPLFWRP